MVNDGFGFVNSWQALFYLLFITDTDFIQQRIFWGLFLDLPGVTREYHKPLT